MRLIDADKLHPDRMTNKGTVAISQSQIAKAKTVEAVPLSVIEDIKAEIERKRDRIKEIEPKNVTASMSGFVLACSEALAIIDKAVKECTHENN